jgi:outer membrane protein OmpA-like peptidoglycan-associated protein
MKTTSLVIGLALMASVGCGPTVFQGAQGLRIVGDLPPAPPPPKPVVAPAAPKRVEVTKEKIVIHEKVFFEFDKSIIKTESHSLLDEVAKTMNENMYIKKVQVEGHASLEKDSPQHRSYNKNLSDLRARAVMEYLVRKGVDRKRLSAKGYGNEKPLADDSTEDGREKNRRVEFTILEQDDVPPAMAPVGGGQ